MADLLHARECDAEDVLAKLGFGSGQSMDIPQRFCRATTNTNLVYSRQSSVELDDEVFDCACSSLTVSLAFFFGRSRDGIDGNGHDAAFLTCNVAHKRERKSMQVDARTCVSFEHQLATCISLRKILSTFKVLASPCKSMQVGLR